MRFIEPQSNMMFPMFIDTNGHLLGIAVPRRKIAEVTFAEKIDGEWRVVPKHRWPKRWHLADEVMYPVNRDKKRRKRKNRL